jgi:F0F1-type ATP synthase epsilon subunit
MGDEEHEVNKTEVTGDNITDAGVDGLTMHVKVYAPFKVYFDGTANSISAINDTGPFDILPKHHNFMTLLSTGDIIVRSNEGEETIKITRGIMHVKADDVVVFLDV